MSALSLSRCYASKLFAGLLLVGLPAAAQTPASAPSSEAPPPLEVKARAEQQSRALQQSAKHELHAAEGRAKEQAREVSRSAVELARVESKIFSFGIFPNTAGFMDARAHARFLYAKMWSSGVYLDYTTARAVSEVPEQSRAERLVREYRAELDALKAVFLLEDRGLGWSLEPGLNAKLIYQDIDDSGYNTNSFDETVFRSTELGIAQWVSSAKLDSTLVLGQRFVVDGSLEYLPLIYQRESGVSRTSQFDDEVRFAVSNRTSGYQLTLNLGYDAESAGRFLLRGRAYRNQGDVSAQSSLVAGNFEYTFETFQRAVREDYWLEVVHTASYIPWFGKVVPAFALAMQQKRITTADDALRADTYKLGFLLEWL
jgi:hypothetical protein